MATVELLVVVECVEEDADKEQMRLDIYTLLNQHYPYNDVEVDFLDDH